MLKYFERSLKISKNKKQKKYNFSHLTQATNNVAVPKAVKHLKKEENKQVIKVNDTAADYFKKDLKKVGIIGVGFLFAILGLYYLIEYTEILKPVLRLFKLG